MENESIHACEYNIAVASRDEEGWGGHLYSMSSLVTTTTVLYYLITCPIQPRQGKQAAYLYVHFAFS